MSRHSVSKLFEQLASGFSMILCFTYMASVIAADDALTILPGDKRFNTPKFDDYQAAYTSAFSKSGAFTLQARKTGNGKKLTLIDIIPGKDTVIVSQRQIDLKSHSVDFVAGPYFAWGEEFIVSQYNSEDYEWSRVPVGGGEPKRSAGEIQNNGSISEMFSPTLAALMPMEVGTNFRIPEAYPRKGEFVSFEFDEYEVLRKERLDLPSGLSCECWVIEKKRWGDGSVERIWVAREAPFVFRRHRDVGGRRDFVSDLLEFRTLTQ